MAKLIVPPDLLDNYAWMKRAVLGLEDQSIKTVRGADYGVSGIFPLEIGKGWEKGKNETEGSAKDAYNAPYARTLSDHTTILGAVRWHSGADEHALILPANIKPFENYTFRLYYDTYEPVYVKLKTDGYLYIPTGNASSIVLNCRYPTPRGGG